MGDDAAAGPARFGRPGSDGPARVARRPVLLRLDPAVHDALERWAADELRSLNAQVDLLVRPSPREGAGRPAMPSPRRAEGTRRGPDEASRRNP